MIRDHAQHDEAVYASALAWPWTSLSHILGYPTSQIKPIMLPGKILIGC